MTRVAISGSAGFIGAALADYLRERGDTVLGIDTAPGADLRADILRAPGWSSRLEGTDVVVHAAAMVGMPSDVSRFWQVNVVGTASMLTAARRAGVARFVLLSSVTVFGNRFPDRVTEEHPVHPTGVPYPDSKIAAEHLALLSHIRGEMETVIVRPGDVYGPNSRPWTLEPIRLIRARRAAVPGRRGVHSPVHIDDLVRGLAAAAGNRRAAGEIITLSGGVGVGTGEFFDYYARMLGQAAVPRVPRSLALTLAAAQTMTARAVGARVELTPAAVRYLADRRGTYGIGKAARLLGWEPEVGIDEGMARTRRWLRREGLLG